jgi:hypothetical protein
MHSYSIPQCMLLELLSLACVLNGFLSLGVAACDVGFPHCMSVYVLTCTTDPGHPCSSVDSDVDVDVIVESECGG